MNPKKGPSLFEIFEVILNTINHVLIGAVSIYMTWLCITVNYRLFNLHVLFCTLGYQLLMTEAILSLYSGNAWTSLLLRRQKGIVHLVLQIVGAGFALTGMGLQIYLKGKFTWISNHAIFGSIWGCVAQKTVTQKIIFYRTSFWNIADPEFSDRVSYFLVYEVEAMDEASVCQALS